MTAAEAAREQRIIDAGDHHGVDGQLNVVVLDVDSSVTNYGRHNRLVVMRDVADPTLLTVREDLRGLPMSTETDQRRAANGWQRLHPRWSRLEHLRSVPYTIAGFGDCIDHEYRIHYARKGPA